MRRCDLGESAGRLRSDASSRTVAQGPNIGVSLSVSYCLVKGLTFAGTGNLAGNIEPKLRLDGRLLWDSPLRGAGGSVPQSRIELDGDLRPGSGRDIGVSQFNDVDADGLPDGWELATAGNTTSIAGAADADGDGLSNAAEYDLQTDWLDTDTDDDGVVDGLEDTDKDGMVDGLEVTLGTNPRVADADDLFGDLNHDGLIDSIGTQLGYPPNHQDDDGDSVSNADELLMCTNPLRADSDGDGVPDDLDAFPLDPQLSALPSNPLDVTPPVITLSAPWYAVPL